MQAAPIECFKQENTSDPLSNKFELHQKIEAKDARNPSAISVATIVQMQVFSQKKSCLTNFS